MPELVAFASDVLPVLPCLSRWPEPDLIARWWPSPLALTETDPPVLTDI